jgi:hypothetical protein
MKTPSQPKNLPDGRIRKDPHREHDPQQNAVCQPARTLLNQARPVQRLLQQLVRDNLLQSHQPVENLARNIRQKRTVRVHASQPPCK